MVIALGRPIRCQQKYPLVISPYARKRPRPDQTAIFLPRRLPDPRRRRTRLIICCPAKGLVRAALKSLSSVKLERQLGEEA